MSSTAWGLQARPSYLVISNDRFVAGGTGSSYKLPLWIRDQWAYSKIEEYKYYWKIIDYPKLIFQKKLVTVKELADILEVKEGTLAFYIMHGCTRYKDFTWDFDFQEYHSRCQQWEDDKVEREAREEEEKVAKRAAFHAIIKEKKAKYKQTNQEINAVKKVWAKSKLEKLKESIKWSIRGQEIKGFGRVYLDGVLSTREEVAKLFKWSDSLISTMCKIGDFEHHGRKVEIRNPPKEVSTKPKRTSLEGYTPEEKRERKNRLAREKNYPKSRVVPKKVLSFHVIPYVIPPKPQGSATYLNGVKTTTQDVCKATGLTVEELKTHRPLGVLVGKDFRIELKEEPRNPCATKPPSIRPAGEKIAVAATHEGKRYYWYCGYSRDTAEQILAEILINDRWKEKVNINGETK